MFGFSNDEGIMITRLRLCTQFTILTCIPFCVFDTILIREYLIRPRDGEGEGAGAAPVRSNFGARHLRCLARDAELLSDHSVPEV